VERAARSVLGDPAEATRHALDEVEELARQVEREMAQAEPTPKDQPEEDPGQTNPAAQSARASSAAEQPRGDDPARSGQAAGRGSAESQPADAQRAAQPGGRAASGAQPFDATGWTGPSGPITGSDFNQWSDRLREVEEMLENPELQAQAATIRERARAMRADLKRHSKEPNWPLVRTLIAHPLVELESRLREELARLESDDQLVPIDRDPVPRRFADQVRRYYERLGSGK
jgi:hypothetical protein